MIYKYCSVKLEKEVEVWTMVQDYLDQDATGTLTPETEVNKPEYKVFLGFKKDEVVQVHLRQSC